MNYYLNEYPSAHINMINASVRRVIHRHDGSYGHMVVPGNPSVFLFQIGCTIT